MRRSLAIALPLLTAAIVIAFLARHWLPPLASVEGIYFDHQFHFTLAVVGAIFILAQCALAFAVARGRAADRPFHQFSERRSELVWICFVLGILVVLAVTGTSALARSRNYAEHDTIHIEVTGLQFQWYFRYPGADGAFGETKPSLIDASVGNPLGLDATDVYAHDDIVSAYAVVPIGRTIDVSLRAQDVIHSFYVPAFRIKQDAVPGLNPHVRFTPDHLGSYDVTCAELCGLGHYRMFSRIEVVSEPDYYRWLAQRAPSASSPGGGE